MRNWIVTAAVATAMVCSVAAIADTIVVTDASLQGWAKAIVNPVGTKTQINCSKLAPAGCPLSFGALYGILRNSSSQFSQVWIGRTDYTGTRLADITSLSYSTYTVLRGWGSAGGTDWAWDHQVQQPFQIQLSVKWDPADTEFHHLVYRPWGLTGQDRGPWTFETWQTWDCLTDGVWADEISGYEIGTWSQLLTAHPNAVIVAPCSTGEAYGENECGIPSPYQTPNGCSLNFVVGARASTHPTFVLKSDTGGDGSWWMESCNFEGFMDNVTIGVNNNGTVTEHTWDFEYANDWYRPVKTYGITNKTLHTFPWMQSARYWYKYTIWGKIMAWSDYYTLTGKLKQFPETEGYVIDDGSGMPVQVRVTNPGGFIPGHYVRATGRVARVCVSNDATYPGYWPAPPPVIEQAKVFPRLFYFVADPGPAGFDFASPE